MYKILLVEDDSALKYVYSKMEIWQKYGFEITVQVSNGKDALQVLSEQNFDMIMTDIRMPFMDGLLLLEKIKERDIEILSVLTSCYDKFEYACQGMRLGAFDFIVKPISEQKLSEVLERAALYLRRTKENDQMKQLIWQVAEQKGIKIESSSFLKHICSYLMNHIDDKTTMEEVAMEMKLSKDYFGKHFKQETGITFNTFYTSIKIEYAKQLIDKGEYKTYEISSMLGYSNPDYFTKIFKEMTHMTPTQYKIKESI